MSKYSNVPVIDQIPRDHVNNPFDPDELHRQIHRSNIWHDGEWREVLGFDHLDRFVIPIDGVPSALELDAKRSKDGREDTSE